MKYATLCTLSLSISYGYAFLQPRKNGRLKFPNMNRQISRVQSVMAAVEKPVWRDLHDFNVALDRLAELAGSPNHNAVGKAEECEILWQEQRNGGSDHLRPDTISLNTVLKAWNKCCQALVDNTGRPQPSDPTHVHTIPVYTPRDAAERATTLLLEHLNDEDLVPPDTTSFNIVIDAWAKSKVEEGPQAAERLLKLILSHDDIEADTVSYHCVLEAWTLSEKPEAIDKVKQIFNHMQGLSESGKNVKPTIRTINSIVNAYSKRASYYSTQANEKNPAKAYQSAADAHDLLKEMSKRYNETNDPDTQPDVTTYTTVMDAYARCGSYEATKQAERLLNELKELYNTTKNPRLRPNFRTYTALITAWSRTRSPESPSRAEYLLEEMGSSPATRPNARSYTSVIQCWAKSRDPTKAQRALKILRDMKEKAKESGEDDIRPTILTYNSVIDACARCQGSVEQQTGALKIAFAILKAVEVDEFVRANASTYSSLIRAVLFLVPPGDQRNQVATAVFEKAKKAGLVDSDTMKNLRKALDGQAFTEALDGLAGNDGSFNYNDIPAEWSKNVNRSF